MWVCVCHFQAVWKCVHWMVGQQAVVLCLPESGAHGVCPCSEDCVRPSEPGFWFQVACSQLAAFVWLKHRETLGFLKMQCHFLCSLQEKDGRFRADYIIFHWWNTFILTRSSRTDGTILCNQHMNGIWMPVLFSHPEHRDYTPALTQTHLFLCCLWKRERPLSTEQHYLGTKEDCTRGHKMIILKAVVWP